MSSHSNPSRHALEQAAEWFALRLSGQSTADDQRRWEAWLSASDEHQQAWRHVEDLSRRFAQPNLAVQPQLALSAYRQAQRAMGRRRRALLGIAALGGAGMLGWHAWRHEPLHSITRTWLADYRSGIGEVRKVTLVDGTQVWLNAVSAFDQDYRQDHRLLTLIQGEILIHTASDPLQRPLRVQTEQGRLRALGTRFAVRRDDSVQTTLAVYEGAVEVQPTDGTVGVIEAGQQRRITVDGMSDATPVDSAQAAWTRGLLIVRDMPLA